MRLYLFISLLLAFLLYFGHTQAALRPFDASNHKADFFKTDLDLWNLTSYNSASNGESATLTRSGRSAITSEPVGFGSTLPKVFDAPPVIVSQVSVSSPEDQQFTILLDHLTVTDENNNFPTGFSLNVLPGDDYTFLGNTITPEQDFYGTLIIPITVTDETGTSDVFYFELSVTPVNDPPKITGQSTLSTNEDAPLLLQITDVTVEDPDNTSGFTLKVLPGTNYTFSGNTITPLTNFNGSLNVNVEVSDGSLSSAPFAVEVTVIAVNDPPQITGQNSVNTNEDTPITLNASHLVISDPDHLTGFTVVVELGDKYTFSGSTVTPEQDYFGPLTVKLHVTDPGGASSNSFDFLLIVNSVNDIPEITGQIALATDEEEPFTIELSHLTVFDPDPDDEYPTGFSLIVGAGTNYSVSGNTITPSLDFNGTLSVPVQVNDGKANSDSYNLQIQVNPVNDAPKITGQNLVSTDEEQPLTILLSHLVISDPDNTNPNDFTLVVQPGSNYTVAGNTITPALNFVSPLTVPVQVYDGALYSNTFNLQVTINPVNDPPEITGQTSLTTNEDESIIIQLSNLVVVDPDNTYPTGFSLTILPGDNYTFSGASVTPATNFNGPLTVAIVVSDGQATSDPYDLVINVMPVNDPPVIKGQVALSTPEDTPIEILVSHVTIEDPDNTTGFTITVGTGTNYSLSGNTVTPLLNFSGMLTVPVYVSDGSLNSTNFNLQIQVVQVNDPPVINAQSQLTTNEDQSIVIKLDDLSVTDPDDTYPTGFSLTVLPGENYTFVGNTVTPELNFNGTLSVPVTVNDGEASSNIFEVQITVNPVNDAPVITGQVNLSTNEEQSVKIELAHLTVDDPDNTFPDDFTLTVLSGANYTVSSNTVTPAQNYTGLLPVQLRVNDGSANSAVFNFQLQVNPVNDAPVITGQNPVSTPEETALTLLPSHLKISDPDEDSDFTINVSPGSNYTVSGTTITPAINFNGNLTVPVSVSDGSATSNTFNLLVQVTPVNDSPVITGQGSVSTNEDQAITIQLSHLMVTDVDNTYPDDFTISVNTGTNYTVSGTTVTPALNFNGTISVPVRVNDGAAFSNVYNLQIQVNPVNDPPVITGQNSVTINEDESLEIKLSHLIVTDVDNTYPTGFTLTVLSGTNYGVSGNTITPALNYNGTLSVRVRVNDGTANSNTFNLQVTVNPVNDAPTITGQNSVSTQEETPVTIQLSHLIISDPDNTSGFTFELLPGENYSFTGHTITPSTNFNGVLSVPVRVSDGIAVSAPYNLQVTVTPVNDPPVIIGQVLLSTEEDTPFTILVSHLTIFDPDEDSNFILTVLPGDNYTFSGNKITPALDFNGTINVNVKVSDGIADSPPFVVQIQVGDANDPPVITGQVPLVTNEDQPITILLEHLTVTDPDNTYPIGFSIQVAPGNNYSVSNDDVIPAPNFFGTLTVPVSVNDGINNSALFNLTITVNSVNDPPYFDVIPDQEVMENSGEHEITITNISKGPFEETQLVVFFASSADTKIISDPVIEYNGSAPTALLKYTVLPDASGTVTITVRAVDNAASPATYTSTFRVTVVDINAAPTLDDIADVKVPEDTPVITIPLTGITAGVGESQPLTVSVTADPAFFEPEPVIVYQSPASTGRIELKPKANVFGNTTVTVTVKDNGSGIAPNVNTVSRTFAVEIESVNDLPVFNSEPQNTAVLNETYTYEIVVDDVEDSDLTISFPQKPDWLTFASSGGGKGKLSGNPSSAGNFTIRIVATDSDGGSAEQTFDLLVNTRPALKPIEVTMAEDQSINLPLSSAFSDADGNKLTEIKITELPRSGILKVNNVAIGNNKVLTGTELSAVVYEPFPDVNGKDTVAFTASDGLHYSLNSVYAIINIQPVNDAPVITVIESDTLKFEVDGLAKRITSTFEADDVDDEMFSGADISFLRATYDEKSDVLLFKNTAKITGVFNVAAGTLGLTGEASKADYIEAIRSIEYNHLNTVNPVLQIKTLTISLNDGKNVSNPKERLVKLTYTFTDLQIPTAFTPNGDLINDTWVIARPGGALKDAVIKVFNKKGVVVYESVGFENPWDGSYNGELLPPDTYYYTIDLKLPNKKTYQGFVTLLR